MPFNQKPQKFNAKINPVTIGSGDKTVTIGGDSTFPFYTFDAPSENCAKIGVEISDMGLEGMSEGIKAYYDGATTMGEIAKKAAAMEGADFVALNLEGGDPNGENRSIDELIAVVKEVAEAVDCPLVVEGCKNVEKDAELLPKVAEALEGRNALILSEKEENYKAIGAAAGLAYNQIVGAESENCPKIGVEISDMGLEGVSEGIKAYYEGATTMADIAKKAAAMEGADFVALILEGGDPNGVNKSIDELIAVVKEVADAVDCPLVVEGCKNVEKDAELLPKVAEALQGRNALILSEKEENYKAIGAAAGLAYNQIVGAESAVDINLAKQLNVVTTQLGVDAKKIVMNIGSAAAGYGYEYVVSTMDRIKGAALGQNDNMLQMPIITPVSAETWAVKEATASEADMPEWGSADERGIDMEVMTAAADLAAGSDAVILRHPESIKTISKMIKALV